LKISKKKTFEVLPKVEILIYYYHHVIFPLISVKMYTVQNVKKIMYFLIFITNTWYLIHTV